MGDPSIDSAFLDERPEHLHATKGSVEDLGEGLARASGSSADDGAADRRKQPRLSLTVPVRLESASGGSLTVRTRDISWGGLGFIAPKNAVSNTDSVRILLPWSRGDQISAVAEVLRSESLDGERAILAARFVELSTSDHHRLEKLLQILRGRDQGAVEQGVPLVPMLEILFTDEVEIHEKLGEIADGRLSVVTFESYKPGQSIRLMLGGIADAPALRLRARVEGVDPTVGSDWVMYDLDLIFEHPLAELKAAAAALERYLPSEKSEGAPEYDSYILLDPLD